MSKSLDNIVDEVLNSELVKSYKTSFRNIKFLEKFELEDI